MIKNAKICSPTFSYSGSRPPETFLTTEKKGGDRKTPATPHHLRFPLVFDAVTYTTT